MQELKVDKISKTDLISLTFIEAETEVTEITLNLPEVIAETEKVLGEDHMIETGEVIIHSEADPEIMII